MRSPHSAGERGAVADAGGNDIVKVDRYGHPSLLAVLPPQPVRITSAMAAGLHLDPCVVGITYKFEAVPTDVEVGRAERSTSARCRVDLKDRTAGTPEACTGSPAVGTRRG